jgi:hypothetical protein
MLDRTTRTTMTFRHPFAVPGLDGLQPAGTYAVETEEELVHGLSFDAYQRKSTFLFLPAIGATGVFEMVNVNPDELRQAGVRDAAIAEPMPS